MKNINKYIYLWCLSIILIFVVLILLISFIIRRRPLLLILLIVSAILFYILYRYSIKKLTIKDGYTVIDAMRFYLKCTKQMKKKNISKDKIKSCVKEIAKDFDFSEKLNETQLIELYKNGETAHKTVKIPDLLLFHIMFNKW